MFVSHKKNPRHIVLYRFVFYFFCFWKRRISIHLRKERCSRRAKVLHPPAACCLPSRCTVHAKRQLGSARICSAQSLSRATVNHRGWLHIDCHECLKTHFMRAARPTLLLQTGRLRERRLFHGRVWLIAALPHDETFLLSLTCILPG